MRIDLKKIPPDGLKLEVTEQVEILNINKPVDVLVFINRTGNTLLINGDIKAKVDSICSRCLKPFIQLLENNDFNMDYDITGQLEIDITPNIREEILVLLPIKPLCKKNCKGLCPSCGQDLNEKHCSCSPATDTRWDGLGRINI